MQMNLAGRAAAERGALQEVQSRQTRSETELMLPSSLSFSPLRHLWFQYRSHSAVSALICGK